MRVRSLEEARARYGEIKDGIWSAEADWCALYTPPEEMTWRNGFTGGPVLRIYCNKDMAPALQRALEAVVRKGLAQEIKTFDGCFKIRSIRGRPDALSTHSYALAIDVNASENPLGAQARLSSEVIKCFTDEGFIWGGDFKRTDPMHFQYAEW